MGLNQLRAPVGLNGLGWHEGFGGGFFFGGGGFKTLGLCLVFVWCEDERK